MEHFFFNLKSFLEKYHRLSVTAVWAQRESHLQNRNRELYFKTRRLVMCLFVKYTHTHTFFFFNTILCFVSILPCFPREILSSILHVGQCVPDLRDSRKEVEFVIFLL